VQAVYLLHIQVLKRTDLQDLYLDLTSNAGTESTAATIHIFEVIYQLYVIVIYVIFNKYQCDHIKEDYIGRICSTHGGNENGYKISIRKPQGKKTLWRPTHRGEYNIKIVLKK
jgi:hypothetical protein